MPLPVRIAAPRRSTTPAPVPDLREPSGGTAMSPGPAAVVAAATQVGNAAVTTALGGRPPSPSAWGTRMLLAGQDLVGNQAVTAAGATAAPATAPERPRPPEKRPATKPVRKAKAPPARAPEVKDTGERERGERPEKKERTGPRSPGADPKFQALKQDVAAKKRRVASSHPPPAVEAGAAQGAAVPPPDDREARGKAAHAEDMDAAQPKEFDKQSFIAAVEKAIRDRAPKNLDEADKFGDSGKAEEVKTEVAGKVGEGKDASSAEIADTTAATPEPAPDAKTVVPLAADQLPGRPGTPNPRQATPDPLPKSATDLSAGPAKVDRQLDSAGVTEKQLSLKNSREPSFDKAVRDKKALEKHSATAPRRMRAGESRELGEVRGAAAASGTAAMGAIHASRATTGRQVTTGKKGTKDRDEDRRTKVTALLQKVFDRTKTDVEKILKDLDEAVDDQFTKGEKTARTQFTAEHTRGMEEYKDRRYSGLRGKARWVKDLFADLPDEANRIYERARDNYLTAMRQVISDVADTVVRELKRAKDRIAKGRAELKQAVDDLPKDLKAIGREAASDFAGKFDELRDSVDDKGTELVDTLATKYTDAVKAVDKEIAEEKEKNKGLASKAVAAVKGAIETIKELGRMLMGVLRKAASAVGLILKDPVGFLGRLITGVAGGLRAFMKDAGRYLQQGVLAWLLGSGVGGGLQLPATFDVLGIVVLLAGLLGLSWANIRARLAKRVSPKTMTAAETGKDAIPLVVEVRKRGVAGMWNDLRGRVGDLKKDLIKNLVSYLLPTIIIAGITWIVSLFNPASAFIRACKMIIDIIRFIVTQGRQIIEFVNAVLDAVIAIARGTANVTGTIVKALARSIPVLIGALAAILGVGGIAGRVRQIFQRLSRPVNRAIDKVITKIQGLLKKLAAKLKPKKPKKPRKPRRDKDRDHRPRRPRRPARTRPRKDRPRDKRRRDKDDKRSLAAALRDANKLIGAEGATVASVRKGLPAIKRRHRLTRIALEKSGNLHLIEVTINPKRRSKEVDLSFPYEPGPPAKSMAFDDVGQLKGSLHAITNPAGEKHRTAYVITMAALPEEIGRNPQLAARYLDEAWAGSTEEPASAIRTAVIIGVNSAEALDPKDKKRGREPVIAAIRSVNHPAELLMIAFGFTWTPRWMDISGKRRKSVPFTTVRAAYQELDETGRNAARAKEKAGLRGSVPYGLIRGEVFKSTHTREAVRILSTTNAAVRVLLQDPDSTATAPKGRGILAAYDEILRTIKGHPMMIIGGYDFERFDWKTTDPFTVQLTTLANRIDRAIRAAVSKRQTGMVYPSEPSTLVTVWAPEFGLDLFASLDQHAIDTARVAMPFGVGPSEGHNFRKWLKKVFGGNFTDLYDPRGSVTTDPGRFQLGIEEARKAIENQGKPAYALFVQSQTMASERKLAQQLFMANPRIAPEGKGRIQTQIFRHVEQVIILMIDNPGLSARDPRIRKIIQDMAKAVEKEAGSPMAQGNRDFQKALSSAQDVTRDIIGALTSKKLRKTWAELRALLRELDRPPGRE
ncbi:hypothetical protein BLA60_21450 [Actinophytocola xinjiangensis]|uniref:Uncharacterized protein n=1 Tax=Actinophytocola xinjiangensis TaxID=485602 RepID=A0A7Z0WK19_9PSEU|nr:hypothetical protein [Actinophytocola xinjiangensis]OLF09140.1 hypothetical protein BLA60_21450 [Actinophytocola xinjiangensis]